MSMVLIRQGEQFENVRTPGPDHLAWCWRMIRIRDVFERVPCGSMKCPGCAWFHREQQWLQWMGRMKPGCAVHQTARPATDGAWRRLSQTIKNAGCSMVVVGGADGDTVYTDYPVGEVVSDVVNVTYQAVVHHPADRRLRPTGDWAPARVSPYTPERDKELDEQDETKPQVNEGASEPAPEPFNLLDMPECVPTYGYARPWWRVIEITKEMGYRIPRKSDGKTGNWRWNGSQLPPEGSQARREWARRVGEYELDYWREIQYFKPSYFGEI